MRSLPYALVTIAITSIAVMTIGRLDSAPAASKWPDRSVAFAAHRGGIVPGYPENTIAAFRQAIKVGAEVLEVDLRGAKDGHVVIIHDKTLDRTTNGAGRATDHTLAELKRRRGGRAEDSDL